MAKTRREFLVKGGLGVAGVMMAGGAEGAGAGGGSRRQTPSTQPAPPGTPPAFGTAPAAGPEVSEATFAEAEKLARVEFSPEHLQEAAGNWANSMAPLYERRTGPKKLALEPETAPATVWDPALPGEAVGPGELPGPARSAFVRGPGPDAPYEHPHDEASVAYASVAQLSRWIQAGKLKSVHLTHVYLERMEQFNKELKCVITVTKEHALEQAHAADKEIAAGHYRGPLHGIPWGAKDLLDTAGIATTYGAEPFKNRVPKDDAVVVQRLNAAGAVLLAKLSMGALALNDVWFGGQTKNPWLLEEGSSGSSAGPGAATAAALVGFSIGSETQGSIVSPSMRCGVTGLRPTFGRVARTGAMTLCWSLDKLGPMARSVEDTMLVLQAISGADAGDVSSRPSRLDFDATQGVEGLRVGYVPQWMQEAPATDVDRAALETVKKLGMTAVPVSLPDWPYNSLNVVLFAEAAAAFEEITLDGQVDQMKMQTPDAWPNTFRQSRFLSAVDLIQAERMRRKVAEEVAKIFKSVDLLLVPSLRDEALVIFNFTGQPSLTLRAGFVEVTEARSDWAPDPENPVAKFATPRRVPHGVTLIGGLFEEGKLGRAGMALEKAFGVAAERPPLFKGGGGHD